MMDLLDHASGIETQFTEMALARQLDAASRQTGNQTSATECAECGDAIPQKRRQHIPGCQYCTPCQELADKGKL
ncbi:molecular chaperone DnaK [Photobacterium halotolerans]|uniref:Molecular chaperone DnaK n=2 Tax=Photobacterium halotolerans TaxID=265726 RepID=A0A0F5VGT3_9GAMM|nr:TraR/DksA C4-type zinc finger protein [Photobacterium halotolerans]KKD01386.1 molecular chaperone DnaK [Photobacterium halotolerans]